MTREFFNGEYSRLAAQWREQATPALAEVWYTKFADMGERRFRAMIDAVLDQRDRMPSIHTADSIAKKISTPSVANKKAIDALLLHSRVLATRNTTISDSSVATLVEIYTGQAWPKAVTDERLDDLKAMLDRVDPVAWEVLEYREYIRYYGVFASEEKLIQVYGEQRASDIVRKAKAAMPCVDMPPTNTTVTRRVDRPEQTYLPLPEPEPTDTAEPWYVKS